MRRITGVIGALAAVLAVTAVTAAGSVNAGASDNTIWAGWKVTQPGAALTMVFADYRAPTLNCPQAGQQDFAETGVWIGLGDTTGIEQIGVTTSCLDHYPQGEDNAWWENYPARSHNLADPVTPGDLMVSSVTVKGHAVDFALRDVTRGWTFTRRTHPKAPDLTSAEWIVEDPAANASQFFPLADFRPVTFTHATAATTGTTGPISGPASAPISGPTWSASQIWMRPTATSPIAAKAGPLSAGGSTFTVRRTNWVTPSTANPIGETPSS